MCGPVILVSAYAAHGPGNGCDVVDVGALLQACELRPRVDLPQTRSTQFEDTHDAHHPRWILDDSAHVFPSTSSISSYVRE